MPSLNAMCDAIMPVMYDVVFESTVGSATLFAVTLSFCTQRSSDLDVRRCSRSSVGRKCQLRLHGMGINDLLLSWSPEAWTLR